MYVGPWQEYRLAKIQNDVMQRLHHDWEAQLQGHVSLSDDDRIIEFMQPLMAKLSSLRVAAKSTSRLRKEVRNLRSTETQSALTSATTSQCSCRPVSAVSNVSRASVKTTSSGTKEAATLHQHTAGRGSNQDSHDLVPLRAPRKPPRPKKMSKKAPLTALEQVQKRKKMFATWIKQAGNGNNNVSGQVTQNVKREAKGDIIASLTLPPIHSAASTLPGGPEKSSSVVLPVIDTRRGSAATSLVVSPVSVSILAADTELEESFNEEDVNKLLQWTDTLLSPQALDSLCNFDN